jgi:flavodoxin
MKAMVVYDSIFGNTEQIAKVIGKALSFEMHVEVLKVNQVKAEQLKGLNLLIVGSPTRAFQPTPAIKKFLGSLPKNSLKEIKVSAFDTRISPADANSAVLNVFVKLFGYAAKPIADKLEKKGGYLINDPEGFIVKGSEGPLKEGEEKRAVDWAKQILTKQ